MPVSPEELSFLRTIYGATDASKDAEILSTGNVGAGNVPDDLNFYVDLAKYARLLNADPAWLLIVMASESNFATQRIAPPGTYSAGGRDVTPRGLIGFTATVVPTVMSWAEWDALPSLSQRDQLGYVYRALKKNQDAYIGGRPYNSAYEVYVSNAAPAALTTSGVYDPTAVLYSGSNWADNLGLDSWPVNFQRQAMLRGEVPEMRASGPLLYSQKLAGLGLLHGKVLLGDLQKYASRMNGQDPNAAGWAGNPARWALAWNLAYRRFLEVTQSYRPKIFPAPGITNPRYLPVSFEPSLRSSALAHPQGAYSGPAFHFDDSMPAAPSGGVPHPPLPVLKSGTYRSAPLLGSNAWGILIGGAVLLGAGIAWAHFK